MQQIELCKQDGPSKHDLGLLRYWLASKKGNFSDLKGPGAFAWGTTEDQSVDAENDFVALSAEHKSRDRFERWAGETLLGVYHRLVVRRFKV